MNKVIHNTTLSLLGVTILSSLLLSSIHVFSDTEVIDEVRLTVPIACTMSGTGTTHTAVLSPGTYSGASGNEYENGIGKTTLTAICNDDNGFSIYAIGFTGNEYGVTNLIGDNTAGTIATKAYVSGDTTSNWSMKLTKVDNPVSGDPVTYNPQNLTISTDYNTWHAVPADYTKVAEYHASTGSSTTDTTLGVKLETTYAAFIASSQAADIYKGQVKYTMVHPYNEEPLQPYATEAGCIRYYANGSNVEGTMGCQSVTDSDTSITLLASNFSRQGYGFAGWSNKFDYATNPDASLKFYGPNEDITFTAGEYTGSNPGLSLYAVWVKSQGSFQDQSKVTELCGTSPSTGVLIAAPIDGTADLSSVSALTDQRDNETYAIARLIDGNCWMVENMRLDNQYTTSVANEALAQGYNTSFTGLANPEILARFDSSGTANSLYSTDGSTANTISGYNQGYRFPRYNNNNNRDNTEDRPENPTSNDAMNHTTWAGMYSYGNYYTWAAAIADTTNYTSNNSSVMNTSICPNGWRLPKGGDKSNETNNEYWAYIVTGLNSGIKPANYGSDEMPGYYADSEGTEVSSKIRTFPNNIIYSGGVYAYSTQNLGSDGLYWTSSVYSSSFAYVMSFYKNGVSPGTSNHLKYGGGSIRCITSNE